MLGFLQTAKTTCDPFKLWATLAPLLRLASSAQRPLQRQRFRERPCGLAGIQHDANHPKANARLRQAPVEQYGSQRGWVSASSSQTRLGPRARDSVASQGAGTRRAQGLSTRLGRLPSGGVPRTAGADKRKSSGRKSSSRSGKASNRRRPPNARFS